MNLKSVLFGGILAMGLTLAACDEKKPDAGDAAKGGTPTAPAAPATGNGSPTTGPKNLDQPPKATQPTAPATTGDPVVGVWGIDTDAVKKIAIASAEKQKGGKLTEEEMKMMDMAMGTVAQLEAHIKADGTFVMQGGRNPEEGTWKKEGDSYVFTAKTDPNAVKFKLQGNLLIVDAPEGNEMHGLQFKRK